MSDRITSDRITSDRITDRENFPNDETNRRAPHSGRDILIVVLGLLAVGTVVFGYAVFSL